MFRNPFELDPASLVEIEFSKVHAKVEFGVIMTSKPGSELIMPILKHSNSSSPQANDFVINAGAQHAGDIILLSASDQAIAPVSSKILYKVLPGGKVHVTVDSSEETTISFHLMAYSPP